jgi:hypothetical protein
MLLRAVPRSDHGIQSVAVAQTKPDFNAFSHPDKFAHSQTYGNLSSAVCALEDVALVPRCLIR